jgi:hypothetical protein
MRIESEMILFGFARLFFWLDPMKDSDWHPSDGIDGQQATPFNPYQPSQTELLQVTEAMPRWFVKLWVGAKQMIDEPTPPVETWSSAIGQVYRWFLLMHVCNLLPLLALWKLCHRWRTGVVVVVLGLVFITGCMISGAVIFVFISEHISWTWR